MVPQVLLIESTSDNPTLRKLLGVASSHPGLSEILDGRNTFEECVYTDNERNINVLFASDIGNRQKASLIFKMVMAQARKDYDIILMDSTQILNSSFTEYLSMNADVVILVIQGDRTMYRTVRRVAEFFIRLEVPAIAAVLNWGGPKYVTRLEKFMEKPFLKFFLERLRNAKE
jgi:Mrp family chromosome partitioning ATPase